jgi:2-(1,2-epoxy-1,2-dihydrophenyl)acetyl-CoA isomerase
VLTSIQDGIAALTLNNPAQLNAFTGDMREQAIASLQRIAADPSVRVLVVTGAGRAFCAGGDVKHMADLKQRDAEFESLQPLLAAGGEIVSRLDALPFPTIAAVNGPAAGAGMNLALACDLRIASDQASFGETFARIGLHLDWGGSYFLPRAVGRARALELCWLADVIDANEALRIGLVNRIVPHGRFVAEVHALAARLAAAPSTSVRLVKRTVRAADHRALDQCLDAEIDAQAACWASADSSEGIRAFTEKRAARFGTQATARVAGGQAGRRFE